MSVTLNTDVGPLKVYLNFKECPNACFNFLAQCARGSIDNRDGTPCARGIEFKIKKPSVAAIPGPEISPELKHLTGTLGLDQPHRSSFYICLEPHPELDGHKVVFGRVASGESQTTLAKLRDVQAVKIVDVRIHANPFAKAPQPS